MLRAAQPYAAELAQTAAHAPTVLLDIGLMIMLVVVAFAIVRMRSLFAIVMLQGVYSLLCAAWFVSLDAVDVAFTEAAVGAGISTVLMLGAMLLTDRQSNPVPMRKNFGPLLIVMIAGAAMFYAIGDMPRYGDANSPANTGPGMEYMTASVQDIDVPNVVTAVLAGYRSFDTMAETIVIFMAGLGVLLLLGLNGHAGRWSAKVQGLDLCSGRAPTARILASAADTPDTVPEPVAEITVEDEPETALDFKPDEPVSAPKRRGRPKGSKNKSKPTTKDSGGSS